MLASNQFYTSAGKNIIDGFTPIKYNNKDNTNIFDYYTGMYSSIFLSSGRSNPEVKRQLHRHLIQPTYRQRGGKHDLDRLAVKT